MLTETRRPRPNTANGLDSMLVAYSGFIPVFPYTETVRTSAIELQQNNDKTKLLLYFIADFRTSAIQLCILFIFVLRRLCGQLY